MSIDFRWGLDDLDESMKNGTHIPGFVLNHYAEVGVAIQEMMLIIHLSAYHFNSARGKSAPSLTTVAHLMGYAKDDSARKLVKSLQDKKLLTVERHAGKPSEYNFRALTTACMALEKSPTAMGDLNNQTEQPSHPSGGPTPPLQWGTPSHPSGGHKNKKEERESQERESIALTSPNSGESSAGEMGNPVQDISEPPKPKPKRARKSNADPVPSALMTPMKNAIAAAFGWSWDGDTPMSEEEVGIIQKAARSLCKAKYTPEGIPALYAFCQRKYDTFGPMALATNVSKFRQSGGKHNGLGSYRPATGRSGVTGPAGGAPPPVIPEERKRFIAEQNERRRKELAAKGFKVPGYTPGTA
jgi:hypothetical protein